MHPAPPYSLQSHKKFYPPPPFFFTILFFSAIDRPNCRSCFINRFVVVVVISLGAVSAQQLPAVGHAFGPAGHALQGGDCGRALQMPEAAAAGSAYQLTECVLP